jgi:hypothetical protein
MRPVFSWFPLCFGIYGEVREKRGKVDLEMAVIFLFAQARLLWTIEKTSLAVIKAGLNALPYGE